MATGLSDIGTKVWILENGVAVDDDRLVVSTNMKVGTYTIAAQPDVPRNVTVTHTTVAAGTDTLGTITVVGTDANDVAITEVITPTADSTKNGTKAFKTITSITGAGWVIAGGNDTIKVGVGSVIGYSYFVPVNKIGAIGGSMDKHESTATDDVYKTYEGGRADTNEVEFGYNYNKTNAARVKLLMDGTTARYIIVEFPDHSGYRLTGKGTDTTSDTAANSLIGATFTFVISNKEWDDDWTTVIRPV